jgi:circadian clock protein KaiB
VIVEPDAKKPARERDVQAEFDEALRQGNQDCYVLRLYITGMTPRSVAALQNLRAICEEYLAGRYRLDVVDVLQEPARAAEANLVAAPTLIKELPLPVRRLLGDLSNTEKVLIGLDLVKRGA